MTPFDLPPIEFQNAVTDIVEQGVQRVAAGAPLEAFCDWFCGEMAPRLHVVPGQSPDDPAASRRLALAMARSIWSTVPVPALRWRAQVLPKTERNAPCYCGSGRKFKHCCSDLTHMPPMIQSDAALGMVLAGLSTDQIEAAPLRQLPPLGLAMAAQRIMDKHGPERVASLLESLFLNPAGLDASHEPAFELLLDALLELRQETRRDKVARVVGECSDRDLATTARSRRVTMLADRGEYEQAWDLFHQTQRRSPDDPQLLHLELVVLLAQGRAEQAGMRAPLLAAKARKLGYDDLAQTLIEIGRDGLGAIGEMEADGDDLDEEEQAWLDLLQAVPKTIDPAQGRALHSVETLAAMEGDDQPVLGIGPSKALAAVERRWRKRFPVETPMLTELDGDAGSILDEPDAAQAFLAKHPDAWLSVNVLNDLLLAAHMMHDDSGARALLPATRALAAHAVALCRALLPAEPARVLWGMQESRPFLRIIAQAIEFARMMRDADSAEPLMRLSLALNPNDNHGWRDLLVQRCLQTERAQEALQWLDRYPDDMSPAGHNRALACFILGEPQKAESAVRTAHDESPRIAQALLVDMLDPPPDEGGPGLAMGGAMEAFYYRSELRPIWARSGALDWLRSLHLPEPKPKRATQAKAAPKLRAGSKSANEPTALSPLGVKLAREGVAPFSAATTKRLKVWVENYERLQGYITAIAWSPGVVMPGIWLPGVMEMQKAAIANAEKASSLDEMNALLGDLMNLYNHLNNTVLFGDIEGGAPLELLKAPAKTGRGLSDSALSAWSAGFVQGAEVGASHWRAAGLPVKSTQMPFKALYAAAARAQAKPQGWRPSGDDGQPLLAGLELDAPPLRELLAGAMGAIWKVIAPMRQHRAGR